MRAPARAAREVEAIVRECRVGAVQSHTFRDSVVARLVRLRRPKLVHVFRVHTYIDSSWVPSWRKRLYHLLDRVTQKGVDVYTPISRVVQGELLERSGIEPRKVVVIPNGTSCIGEPDGVADGECPLPARVIMVANFVEHKGHDVLVRCLERLKRCGLVIRARLVGGDADAEVGYGAIRERVKKLAGSAGVLEQLEFFGFTWDVYGAMKDYSVVVLPSESEGVPLSLLDAMGLRKLIVASRVGGIPEIIEDGTEGLFHRAGDDSRLAEILARIFTTPAARWEGVRNQAMQSWRTRFSADRMLGSLGRLHKDAWSERRS